MKVKILFLAMVLSCSAIYAQETITRYDASNYRTWSLGLNIGTNYSLGDSPNLLFSRAEPFPDEAGGFTFGIRGDLTKFFTPSFGLRVSAGVHSIGGYNSGRLVYYDGYNTSGDLSLMMNLSNMFLRGKAFSRKNTFLFGAGLGVSYLFTTYRNANGDAFNNLGNDNSGLSDTYAEINSLPLTLNYKRQINERFDFDAIYRHEIIFNDWIDGVSSPNGNDGMIYLGVGVTYNFMNKALEDESIGHVIYTNPLDDMVGVVDKARRDFEKLSTDDDGDGVSNFYDKDNATPAGTVVDGAGSAIDSDMDGIADYMDEDPFTAKGAKVDAKGRAIDSDGDGVADHMDQDNNTPAGALVNFQGKAIDQHLDNGNGGLNSGYMPSVFFGFNSATVSSANHLRLAAIARALKSNDRVQVKVIGYTDETGPEQYNRQLGERRAQAVVKQLVQVYGIAESRFTVESAGESNPLASRNDVNRRVDFILQ